MRIIILLLMPFVGFGQWISLANNRTVTFNNLWDAVNTGIFIQKQTIPVSQKTITKSEAATYVYINTSTTTYANKASNQLVAKQDLVSAPPSTVVYRATSGLYPLSGNTFTTSSGVVTNYTSSIAYLYIVFNSAGLTSGSVSGDNMLIIPQPSVSVSGTITGTGQLLYGLQYALNPGTSYNIQITKNDGLGGGSTVSLYWTNGICVFCSVPVTY